MHIVVEFQNRRQYMEDRYLITRVDNNKTLYGVFDGHGGEQIAELCKNNIGELFKQCLLMYPHDVSIAIHMCFGLADKLAEKTGLKSVGTTVALCYITPERIWFANAGDSMSMMTNKAGIPELMSYEHKVENEKERIREAGGLVTYWDGVARINGMLNVARGVGDYHLKDFVICTPFVRSINRKQHDYSYVLIASDGIWDVYDVHSLHHDLQQFIQSNTQLEMDRKTSIQKALADIVRTAVHRGSSDNITILYIDQSL